MAQFRTMKTTRTTPIMRKPERPSSWRKRRTDWDKLQQTWTSSALQHKAINSISNKRTWPKLKLRLNRTRILLTSWIFTSSKKRLEQRLEMWLIRRRRRKRRERRIFWAHFDACCQSLY